jgi:hypothetical protein
MAMKPKMLCPALDCFGQQVGALLRRASVKKTSSSRLCTQRRCCWCALNTVPMRQRGDLVSCGRPE